MAEELNPHEARVLGVLIEKAFTTPDAYPLSINGATTASNQKSNRDPLLTFTEAEVRVALQGLVYKHYAGGASQAGSRVEKWRHNAPEHLGLDGPQVAVLAELLLRGPQSAAALKTRASRMVTIGSEEVLERVLAGMIDKGYVRRLPPGGGSRVERWQQCLAPSLYPDGEPGPSAAAPSARSGQAAQAHGSQAEAARAGGRNLESRVDELAAEVAELKRQLADLTRQLGGV